MAGSEIEWQARDCIRRQRDALERRVRELEKALGRIEKAASATVCNPEWIARHAKEAKAKGQQ